MATQTAIRGEYDIWVKQKKKKVVQVVYTHGCMQLSNGHAHILGLINIAKKHRIKKREKNGSMITPKKSVVSVLKYLKWEDKKYFRTYGHWKMGQPWYYFPM